MENKEFIDGKQESHITDKSPLLALGFYGQAKITGERKGKVSIELEIITRLNTVTSSIEEEIKKEIERKLPAGLEIVVDVQFSFGSIQWNGIVAILDSASISNSRIDFDQYMFVAIKLAVSKVIRKQIERFCPVQDLSTIVQKLKHPIKELQSQNPELSKSRKNNPWLSGSFYLFSAVILLIAFAVISANLPWYTLPIAFVGGLLSIVVVGALQLRNDDTLSESNFLNLMVESLKRLPLLRNRQLSKAANDDEQKTI